MGQEEAEELAVGAVPVGLEAEDLAVDVGVEEGQAAGAVVGPEEAVDVGVEVGQAEVAAARRVAAAAGAARRVAAALPVAWEVLTRIIPAALLSVTTRWLPYQILFARRTASRP